MLTISIPSTPNDPDPVPRAAPVGNGSAFAAVASARRCPAHRVELRRAKDRTARVERPVSTWEFLASEQAGRGPGFRAVRERGRAVTVPDGWSRRDPALADYRGPVYYAAEVTAGAGRARLVFDRLDYLARVMVNGQAAALHEGGFTPVAVELPAAAAAQVLVRLDDPVEDALTHPDPLMRPKLKIKGVQEEHDSRPGGMPWGSHFTPMWARRWGSGGIAGAVHIHESGDLRLVAVFATPVNGRLHVSWVVENLAGEVDAELSANIAPAGRAAASDVVATVRLRPGASRVAVVLDVTGEKAWSPEQPALYGLHAEVRADGVVSDAQDIEFGFREVRMPLTGREAFQLTLNGKRTYVRAANYIPGVWPAEWNRSNLARDVELARAAHLNSFGIHANVCLPVVEEADRQGMLIYQDFPLQWSYDCMRGPLVRGGPTFADASLHLAAELAYLLHNHPSVVYWCCHNEPAYQLAEIFKAVAADPAVGGIYGDMTRAPNEEALDKRRQRLFRRIDPTRPALHCSGLGATRRDGDVHDYAGSLSGGSVGAGSFGRKNFISEYGSWASNFSAAERAPGATGDWPPVLVSVDTDWYEQTHLLAVQNTFAGQPSRYTDFQTWTFAAQLWAGWNAKVSTEMCRLARFNPSAGQRYHFFLDHFGDAGAGMVDRHRATGPGYRGLAAANRPVVALAPWPAPGRVDPGTRLRLPIRVINDLHKARRGAKLTWRLAALGPNECFLVGRDDPGRLGPLMVESGTAHPEQVAVLPRAAGTTLVEGSRTLDLPADSITDAAAVEWVAERTGPIALFMDLDGEVSWSSFVVEPQGWVPTPGLTGPRRFRVTSDIPGELRSRWTGGVVDAAAAPPDQYLLGDLEVDVFDDTHVAADRRVTARDLPWPDPR